jgi:inositol oxygenase
LFLFQRFLKPGDEKIKQAVIDFNKYDLYSKDATRLFDIDEMKTIYLPLIEKYLGKGPVAF